MSFNPTPTRQPFFQTRLPHQHHRSRSSWSSLSGLLRSTPSALKTPLQNQDSWIYETDFTKGSGNSSRSPLASKINNARDVPDPHYYIQGPTSMHSGYGDSRSSSSRHCSTPASSQRSENKFGPHRGHSRSTSLDVTSQYQTFPVPSSAHSQASPSSCHSRSRSESFSTCPSWGASAHPSEALSSLPSPGGDRYGPVSSHKRSRSTSFSQAQSISSQRPSTRLKSTHSFSSSAQHRRVRFVVPALLHTYLSHPPFRISVKRPPPSDLADYYHPYLSHPATEPRVSFMLITTPHIPWPIRISAQPKSMFPSSTYHTEPLAYLSAHDVLTGIYTALREPISVPEYEALRLKRRFCQEVFAAYDKRRAQETRGLADVQEPLRRIDWLVGRTRFEGLEKSMEGEGVWKLKLRRS